MKTAVQPRALKTRARILRAATRLFTAKGYHDTKLDDIRRAAKVTTGAFFHHFTGKEDLGFAVLDHYLDERGSELDQVERELFPVPSADPLERVFERVQATRHRFARRMRSKQAGCIFGNFSTTLCETHAGFRRRLAECFDAMALDFKVRLDEAVARHRPGQAIDTMALARYLISILEGSIILARVHQDDGLLARHFQLFEDDLRRSLSRS
ncbi:MAG: TetR/AcrR family transcriptional regulator [Gemmataceae bacterium]